MYIYIYDIYLYIKNFKSRKEKVLATVKEK